MRTLTFIALVLLLALVMCSCAAKAEEPLSDDDFDFRGMTPCRPLARQRPIVPRDPKTKRWQADLLHHALMSKPAFSHPITNCDLSGAASAFRTSHPQTLAESTA